MHGQTQRTPLAGGLQAAAGQPRTRLSVSETPQHVPATGNRLAVLFFSHSNGKNNLVVHIPARCAGFRDPRCCSSPARRFQPRAGAYPGGAIGR